MRFACGRLAFSTVIRSLRPGPTLGALLGLCTAGGCALFFPSGEYVGEGGEAGGTGEGAGATTSTGPGGGGGGGSGGGSQPGDAVARVFVAFGDRDKPPELPGSFETKTTELHYADVDAEGVIGAWSNAPSTPLRGDFSMRYVDGSLVAFGRSLDIDGYARPTLMRSALDSKLLPSTWNLTLDATTLTYSSRQVVLGPKGGYIAGGYGGIPDGNGGTTYIHYDTIEFVPADLGTGALSPRVDAPTMPEGKRNPGLLVHGGALYVVGGYGTTASPTYKTRVDHAVLDEDGLPGAFQSDGELPGTVANTVFGVIAPAVCASDTHLFIAGGTLSSGSASDFVLSAEIQADKSLGTLTHVTKLPTPLASTACFVLGGNIYVIGGQGATSRSDLVLTNEILAGGALGADWNGTSNARLPYGRSGMAVAVAPLGASAN